MTRLWRVRFAPNRGTAHPTRIRITIGGTHRDFPPADARAVADRLHDLADTIESHQEQEEGTP